MEERLMSGTQMPTQQSLAAFEHVFNDLAKPAHVETALGSAQPFLMGDERFGRYLSIMLECGRARLAAPEAGGSQ
jgi:hypothetical protein